MRPNTDIPARQLTAASQPVAGRPVSATGVVESGLGLSLEKQADQKGKVMPASLSLLRDPELVADIDLTDTSQLWELE